MVMGTEYNALYHTWYLVPGSSLETLFTATRCEAYKRVTVQRLIRIAATLAGQELGGICAYISLYVEGRL